MIHTITKYLNSQLVYSSGLPQDQLDSLPKILPEPEYPASNTKFNSDTYVSEYTQLLPKLQEFYKNMQLYKQSMVDRNNAQMQLLNAVTTVPNIVSKQPAELRICNNRLSLIGNVPEQPFATVYVLDNQERILLICDYNDLIFYKKDKIVQLELHIEENVSFIDRYRSSVQTEPEPAFDLFYDKSIVDKLTKDEVYKLAHLQRRVYPFVENEHDANLLINKLKQYPDEPILSEVFVIRDSETGQLRVNI